MQKTWMIGELAELLGVSRDTLRIYEEQGLLKPMRDENGFRVYSEENICRLVGIRFYRESLLPIKSVRQLMEDLPAEEKLSLLGKQNGDMTHCYLNAEYDMDQDCRAPERTCLILKSSELRLLGREDLLPVRKQDRGGP